MPETIIESVLTGKLDSTLLLRWLNRDSLEDVSDDCVLLCCDRNEFVTHFLSFLRRQTDSILQTNTSALQVLQHQNTPEKLLSSRKHHRSISDPTYEADRSTDTLSVKPDRKSHESPGREKKRTGRRVKTKLFESEKSRDSISSEESRISMGVDRLTSSSTPMKNGMNLSDYPNLPLTSPVTPYSKSYERCDTPRLSYRHSRSHEKSCLGDYLTTAQKSSKKKRNSRNMSDDSDISTSVSKDLDLSNSDVFPEIGARKSSSLKSDKRRIKPTNIDRSQKSQSLNSFTSECFQQPSPLALEDNEVLKAQKLQPKELSKSFDVERKILKQDRAKLMEKFNLLNTTASPKTPVAPQIRIMQKESIEKPQNFIKTEPTKVIFKEKLDVIIEVYESLIRNNLILSMNMEIYYLISVLLSQQLEEEYIDIEIKLNKETVHKLILKSIHNTTYFSVKSLWYQREVLEVILDKNSLKLLGENKRVRAFCPELAKFLLNLYGLKCEAEIQDSKSTPDLRVTNGVVCFNFETDNIDNFPSMAYFQNFKKQRDMFYELLRWYSCGSGGEVSSLRSRVRALVGGGGGGGVRLASLLVAQLGQGHTQDSKLNKLARRLTRPAQDNKQTHFNDQEMFYRDVLVCAESDSFRTHVRDALVSEICTLNCNSLASPDITKDYIHLVKKLCLLSKFLGFLTSLPYTQANEGGKSAHRETYCAPDDKILYQPPKEKVLDNNLVLRSCTQPCIDLKGILEEAKQNGRLSVTIPWIVQYLVILDYTSLRTKYIKELLNLLFEIYIQRLRVSDNSNYFKKNTIIYLKSVLGWLCSQNHFPQEFFYEKNFSAASDEGIVQIDTNKIDFLDFVDENVVLELCPYVKDVGVLLSTSRVPQEQKESTFRHITPVSLSLNPEERLRNKEKELQKRLEEQIVRSMPSSTRRVLELVTERMYHVFVKQASTQAAQASSRAVTDITGRLREGGHKNPVALAESILKSEVDILRKNVISSWQNYVKNNHLSESLSALSLEKVHASLVARGVQRRLHTRYSTTGVLCKDIDGLVKSIIAARGVPSETEKRDVSLALISEDFDKNNVSAAQTIIDMVELVQLVLSGGSPPRVPSVLAASAAVCDRDNVFSTSHSRNALLHLTVDLAAAYVARRPDELTDNLLSLLDMTWRHFAPDPDPDPEPGAAPDAREFGDEIRAPTPDTSGDEMGEPPKSTKKTPPKLIISTKMVPPPSIRTPTTPNDRDDHECAIFSRLLCPRNITLLSTSTAQSWRALSTLIQHLRKKGFCQEQDLAESCLSVYTQEYSKSTLENLSSCIKSVSTSCTSNTGKVSLFLDFLSEYCRDMDLSEE